MSDPDRNKATLRRLYDEVVNGRDLAAADALITEDRPDHDPNLPPEMTNDREGFKLFFAEFHRAFPDARFASDFMVAEGDMVISYNTISGTHHGSFMGIPPTGREFTIANADVCRFTDDARIAEHWGVLDMLGLMRQLGMADPAPWQAQT